MTLLNLGILAHVDAGKTSLTERLLHDAGVLDELGSVDAGTTATDSLALERERGITIKSAVVSFPAGDTTVTLIDTPGHPDFIAEVERALGVLDGAILVVSAVEGVQAQTLVLMRALQRLRIPVLLFVNKIDRSGARPDEILAQLARRLSPAIVAMGTVRDPGTPRAAFVPGEPLPDVLADHDDALLTDLVTGVPVGAARLHTVLAALTARSVVHPVFFGSAVTGAGVAELTAAITALLPPAGQDDDAPVSASVFKVERGPSGEKIAYARLFAGTLHVRDKVAGEKITALETGGRRAPQVGAGRIAKLWGLSGIRIGDPIGVPHRGGPVPFAPPSLETVVVPADPRRRGAVHAALAQLAEQDPLIGLRADLSLSLYGEVQKQVVEATLAAEYGLAVTFRESTTICVERPAGTAEVHAVIREGDNPYLATVGLRVGPGPGFGFRLQVEPGSMPAAFFTAVRQSLAEALRSGPHGWQVVDVEVVMTRSGYWARQSHAHGTFDKSMSSTAGDFRAATAMVLAEALRQAGTVVCEPVHRFTLELPGDTLAAVLPVLAAVRAVPSGIGAHGVDGTIPAARVHELRRALPALTRGEGVLDTAFDSYQPVRGAAPERDLSGAAVGG